MIPFADLAPGPVEITGSLCFTLSIGIPIFAVFLYIFQRVLRGPDVVVEEVEGDPPDHDPDAPEAPREPET